MATIPRTPRPGGGSKRAAAKSVALVVDDEPALRELLSTVLRSQSFLAVTACSAAEALELSGRTGQRIDVLISDVQLGDGNGIDVAAQILSSRPEIAVLLISGKPEYEEQADAKEFAFLRKPFLPQQLLTAVERVMMRRRGQCE